MSMDANYTSGEEPQQEIAFSYTYSAPEQDEVKKIRQKYLPREESVMEQLRRLDAGAANKGMALALVTGIIGTLIFGVGMCCCMVGNHHTFIPGVVIGCVGILGAAMAYPIFAKVTKKEQERIAPEILRLTEELLK